MGTSVFLLLLLVSGVQSGCRNANWGLSFDQTGLSRCDSISREYIRGLYRSRNWDGVAGGNDGIYRIQHAVCCTAPSPYYGDKTQISYADWYRSFDEYHRWNMCPRGFFLQGLHRSGNENHNWGIRGNELYRIEDGRCMKPASHPYTYGHCYDHDIRLAFDDEGTVRCRDNYFVTGFYKGPGEQLYHIEKMKCCKMAPRQNRVDSLASAKTKVMDNTLRSMALLAHYLGYGWCSGCRAPYVGEDFRRSGDTWVADQTRRCSGHMSDHRLSIKYDHWKFSTKSMVFGESVLHDLEPQTVLSGEIRNRFCHEVTRRISQTNTVERSVTHTKTSSWGISAELGITVGYTPPGETGGVHASATFTFGYEQSSTTTNSEGNKDRQVFTVNDSVVVPANTAMRWRMIISKTRRTLPYTAKILIHFSAEFRGFMRHGGGYHGASTNYHREHRGSGDRDTVNYRFGDANEPFFTALNSQSRLFQDPWMWADLEAKYGHALNLIRSLTSEGRYEFTLTGKFDDVKGNEVHMEYDNIPLRGGRTRCGRSADRGPSVAATNVILKGRSATRETSATATNASLKDTAEAHAVTHRFVAQEQPGDTLVFPPPPVVELDPVFDEDLPSNVLAEGN